MIGSRVERSESEATPAAQDQCLRCMYRLQNEIACVAFPWGIPADIREGHFDHRRAYPGDGGFRFVPRH